MLYTPGGKKDGKFFSLQRTEKKVFESIIRLLFFSPRQRREKIFLPHRNLLTRQLIQRAERNNRPFFARFSVEEIKGVKKSVQFYPSFSPQTPGKWS